MRPVVDEPVVAVLGAGRAVVGPARAHVLPGQRDVVGQEVAALAASRPRTQEKAKFTASTLRRAV